MLSCPCGEARVGAASLTVAIYWLGLTGISPMLALVMGGTVCGITWALLVGAGVAGIVSGVSAALTHDDAFRSESFLWSVSVLALGVYALLHRWVLTDTVFNYHLSRALWFGWMASNAVNIWLQLRGSLSRPQPVATMQTAQQPSLRRRRRMTTEWLEELEGHGINAAVLPPELSAAHLPIHVAPSVIEHDGSVPQLVYVKQGDRFVPVHLANVVPVERQLR